jgi:hypothetical protein
VEFSTSVEAGVRVLYTTCVEDWAKANLGEALTKEMKGAVIDDLTAQYLSSHETQFTAQTDMFCDGLFPGDDEDEDDDKGDDDDDDT